MRLRTAPLHTSGCEQAPVSEMRLPSGPRGEMETVGRLCGSYTFADEAFRKAGMLVLLHGPSASSRALAHDLQARLHFLSLAFVPASARRLAAAAGSGEGEDDAGDAGYSAFGGDSLEAGAEELHIVMRFLQAQQPALQVLSGTCP